MTRIFLSIAFPVLFFVFSGCSKDSCSPKAPSSEAMIIQDFANANGMTAVAHSSGMYYEILSPGTGATANLNSNIFITYSGTFLDGTQFDQQSDASQTGWPLGELIEGWRVGIPLIKEGGRIRLVVPSAMAYGCNGYGIIPGNTVLFFDITLVDVQ